MNQPRLLKENIFENLVPENPPLIGSLGPKVNPFQRKISPKKVSLKALKKKRFKNWSFLIGLDWTRLSATWLEKKETKKVRTWDWFLKSCRRLGWRLSPQTEASSWPCWLRGCWTTAAGPSRGRRCWWCGRTLRRSEATWNQDGSLTESSWLNNCGAVSELGGLEFNRYWFQF